MAHEVYEIAGEHSMAYVQGVMPWHGLGQRVNPDATIEEWKRTAHLDWEVWESPVIFGLKGAPGPAPVSLRAFNGKKALYRSDTGEPFAVVSEGYNVVQPGDILEFFRNLTEIHGLKIHTAGSLRGGKRVWALASIPKGIKLGNGDLLHPFVLLATSYDKSLSTTGKLTTVEVVCNNTLDIAYGQSSEPCVKVPHCAVFDPEQVKIDLGLAEQSIIEFAAEIDRLSNRPVSLDEAKRFFLDLFHDPAKEDDYSDVPQRVVRGLAETYVSGVGQDKGATRDTAWGLVTAVTRYYDHESQNRSQDYRLESAWFGRGNNIKRKALALANTLTD
jgi:phage/plasmid-like protein (TIGR03299 family)